MESLLRVTQLENWRWVQGWNANARGVLFGGAVLSWVDEDTTMLAYRVAKPGSFFTTVGMDRIAFKSPGLPGDRLCFRYSLAHVGNTSLTIKANVYKTTDKPCYGEFPLFAAFATLVSVYENGEKCSRLHLLPEVESILDKLRESSDWKLVEKIRSERKTDGQV